MHDPSDRFPDSAPARHGQHDRLESWKEIAVYLGRGVTTVQRWEQDEGLPIHRLPHAKKGSIFAFKSELDAWRESRVQLPVAKVDTEQRAAADVPSEPLVPRRTMLFVAAAVALSGLMLFAFRDVWLADRGVAHSSSGALVAPRPLANGVEAEISPSLSPDGTQVVFARWTGKLELAIKPLAGGPARPVPVATEPSLPHVGYPAWSPRGDLIAFLGEEGRDAYGLFVVSPSGGSARRLTRIAGIGLCWSPSGDRIGFVDRNSASEPFSVFSMSLTDGHRTRLTVPPPASFGDTRCAFSPDGRSLAVARFVTRYESHLHVVALDANDGAQSQRLTNDVNGIAGVAWTPDGGAIVFGAAQGLWKVSVAGRQQKPVLLAGMEAGAAAPAFSRPAPGRPAALVYQHHARDVNIWRRALTSDAQANATRITTATWWDNHPALSPDGTLLAFTSNRTGTNELWVADSDGSNPRQLTFHVGPLVLTPQWSPDGRTIAFSSPVGGNRDVYVINADGSGSERLTTEPSEEENPSWSRDGRWIYFRSDRGGIGQLWKMPHGGGSALRVTTGEASEGFESPDGTMLYFVRNVNVPGLWAVPVGGGQETLVVPNVYEGFWAVADRGIVHVPSRMGIPGERVFELRFFDFASRTVSTIGRQPVAHLPIVPGFSVSRDHRTVFWCQTDTDQDDIMLIDPWIP